MQRCCVPVADVTVDAVVTVVVVRVAGVEIHVLHRAGHASLIWIPIDVVQSNTTNLLHAAGGSTRPLHTAVYVVVLVEVAELVLVVDVDVAVAELSVVVDAEVVDVDVLELAVVVLDTVDDITTHVPQSAGHRLFTSGAPQSA